MTGQQERKERRAHVFLAAVICDASSSAPVRIRDLSSSGALLDGPSLPPLGSLVRLVRSGLVASGEIVWERAGRAGIQFTSPVDAEAWVKVTGSVEQQRVDELVAGLRKRPVPQQVPPECGAPLTAISADLDQLCDRIADLANQPERLTEELLKLENVAESLRRWAARQQS